jgi:hypothetical protein
MTITSDQDVVKASSLHTIALSIPGMNAGAFRAERVSDYEFASVGELNAFLYGCDEANGWLDMEQIDPNPDGSFSKPDANDE